MKGKIKVLMALSLILLTGCKSTHEISTTSTETTEHTFKHETEIVTLPTTNTIILPAKMPAQTTKVGTSTIIIKPELGDLSSLTIHSPGNISRIDTVYVEKESTTISDTSAKTIKYKTPKLVWWIILILAALVVWSYRSVIFRLARGIFGLPPLP